MDIRFDGALAPEDMNRLRAAVGFRTVAPEQARRALAHSFHVVAALDGGRAVGYARVVSDGGFVFYIAEVVVEPAYQGQGVGRALMDRVMARVRAALAPGERASVCLMAAKGREAFYAPYGFQTRPNGQRGAGMSQWIECPAGEERTP